MENELTPWPRRYYSLTDQAPYLFYVVFGASVGEQFSLSCIRHRCDGIPEGIGISAYGPDKHPDVITSFQQGYLWEELQTTNPALADEISTQTECVIIQGHCADDSDLNYFRNVIGLITALLESDGVGVFDPQSFMWWSAADWRTSIFDTPEFQPHKHVTILVSEESDDAGWWHTRGMRKFGRPDLSIHGVHPENHSAIKELFDRFIEYLVHGGVINENQEIKMKSLPAGLFCRHGGNLDDPDFNNFHVEIKNYADEK